MEPPESSDRSASREPPTRRGPRLTLEDVASAPAIRKRFRQSVEAGCPSRLERDAEVSELLLAASLGDDAASEALGIAAEAMAAAVASLCWINDPARVVFGGGVGSNPIFVDAVPLQAGSPPGRGRRNSSRRRWANRAAFLGAVSAARASVRTTFVRGRLGRADRS